MACVAALVAMVGCQAAQYKVVDNLPTPAFGDEHIPPVPAATAPQTAVAPQPAAGAGKPVSADPPAAKAVAAGLAAPVADWDHHVCDNGWRYIIVHHSDSVRGDAAIFDREHKARGWDGLGYHFVIGNGSDSRDGQVEVGFRWRNQEHGAHCKTNDNRFNDFGIGICLVGNFQSGHPTAAQMASLTSLVSYLAAKYHIPAANILGHREAVAMMHEGRGTECPGRNFDMDAFRQVIRSNRVAWVKP
jgi:hypothetical protein